MKLLFALGLIFPSIVLGQTVNNVKLLREVPYKISNPQYPGGTSGEKFSLEWNLEVEDNARVKIACNDIRMVQRGPWTDDCPNIFFSVTDGKGERKVCGSGIFDFVHKSDGPNLKVKIAAPGDGYALISCTALNIGEPEPEEIVQLEPNGRAWRLNLYDDREPKPYLDRLWKFESPEGTRISFQCDMSLRSGSPTSCGFSVLTINDGVDSKEYCTPQRFVQFSKINKAKLRFQLDEYGDGRMECLVQAVTGPNANEYENVVSEEVDSSEHGVTPGSKKTSCKCGWANKNIARVVNGEETRINEFPWMVHLSVRFETDQGSFDATCGASIVTPRHVITAAHCVSVLGKVEKPENVKMILGKHDSTKPTGKEVIVNAEKVFVPKLFLEKGLAYHDFAVIFTKQTIEFNNIIGPICIEPTELPVTNKQAVIMGWGLTEERRASDYLRKAKVRVMDINVCGENDWDVCTATEPKTFCSGDSGGPLVWLDKETNRYTQLSLVSRGFCIGKTPSISTKVSYFYSYLQEVIRETEPSVATCHKV
uniref:Secreted S1 protease protein n=1 Tax=Pristhesancus plagipennis TaxID=1955184 RepID=A0A1Q1NPH1_PRIPG|nr:venom s1 protease 39 [Pristhesancus plagipennis]ATU82934.1 secreted S1 protease protein [Pristhesancus plagipennis]